jgi:hypothetical protein
MSFGLDLRVLSIPNQDGGFLVRISSLGILVRFNTLSVACVLSYSTAGL